jgi:hypothetical protein
MKPQKYSVKRSGLWCRDLNRGHPEYELGALVIRCIGSRRPAVIFRLLHQARE